jgi:hypothetical protein
VGAIGIALMRPREWTNILTLISRTGGDAMKLIIEARVECTDSDLQREPFTWRSLTELTTISSSWG